MKRLGLICRMDNGGLGNQTREMYNHLNPTKVLVVDISMYNHYEQHPERYPGKNVRFHKGFLNNEIMDWITDGIDVVMTVEIPYHTKFELFNVARAKGVKTILQYNYEFLEYFEYPQFPLPDLLLAPSVWNLSKVPYENKKFIPVPVNRELFPYKHRTSAKVFAHIAGHKTFEDRNGTDIVLEATKHIKSDAKVVIFAQDALVTADYNVKNTYIVENDFLEYNEALQSVKCDVLLLPRRYGGLSLQMNEALSLGMPVIMSDVSPNKYILPSETLIKPKHHKEIYTRVKIDCDSVDPIDLAKKIDELYNDKKLVKRLSKDSNAIAEKIDWKYLKNRYLKEIEEL